MSYKYKKRNKVRRSSSVEEEKEEQEKPIFLPVFTRYAIACRGCNFHLCIRGSSYETNYKYAKSHAEKYGHNSVIFCGIRGDEKNIEVKPEVDMLGVAQDEDMIDYIPKRRSYKDMYYLRSYKEVSKNKDSRKKRGG